jgi:uncharacterized membrane protein
MKIFKWLGGIFLSVFFLALFMQPVLAREEITDWYIKDFKTEITVNKDSSLDITETILADCGLLPEKHGIFRVLPRQFKTTDKTFITPVEIVGVYDELGNPRMFSETKEKETISLKIGDPEVTVAGENTYVIKYKVKNAIIFDNGDFAELYWNLTGNFWELEIDNFNAKIIFPTEITKDNAEVYYYTGYSGSQATDGAEYKWSAPNILEFQSLQMLNDYEGITASVTFPKNIITPYVLTFQDKTGYTPEMALIGLILLIILPLISLIISYRLWSKHGRDPRLDKTIVPEFEIPEKLSPMDMGGIMKSGGFRTRFITAGIVNLGVKGYLTIEEKEKKIPFLSVNDCLFTRSDKKVGDDLCATEIILLEKLFDGQKDVLISELKNSFHKHMPKITTSLSDDLDKRGYVFKKGLNLQTTMMVAGGAFFIFAYYVVAFLWPLSVILMVTGLPLIVFGILMPKRTSAGAELNWRIEGFRLYMNTAEKYRSRFQEKENIMEKLLPYAILFKITGEWLRKMKDIYGEKYFTNYHSTFFISTMAISSFDSFASSLDSITSSIASNVSSSSSGSSGGGSSGGGGGGGGGGGW